MKAKQFLLIQFILGVSISFIASLTAKAQIISTYAGTGSQGYSGDGGSCLSATFKMGWGKMAQDSSGNLYIVDDENYVVRKITAAGIISTFAGNGVAGATGDGGPATAASLETRSSGIAVDATGNVYIGCGARIRKVSTSGIISTFVGNGTRGFSGDGGPATMANITASNSLMFDRSGNLYFTDRADRIRKITPSGIISTVAGTGTAGASGDGGPATAARIAADGLIFDADGNYFFVDGLHNKIRKVDTSGIITTLVGGTYGFSGDGGPVTAASISFPLSIAADARGNIYFYDHNNFRLRRINTSGIISTIGGNGFRGRSGDGGPATAAEIDSIQSIVVKPSGDIYLYCGWQQKVRKISASSTQIADANVYATTSLLVAPNPSHGKMSVMVSSAISEPIIVTVINTLGLRVKDYSFDSNVNNELDLHLPPGIYFMSALSSTGRNLVSFVID